MMSGSKNDLNKLKTPTHHGQHGLESLQADAIYYKNVQNTLV